MNTIGLIYSFNSNKTAKAAAKIADLLSKNTKVETVNAETLTASEFMKYKTMILAVPTWFDGELPNYWDEFIPELEELDLKGKTFALFGPGDQKGYPENFVDGIGIMAEYIEKQGGKLIGFTENKNYTFERSRALRAEKFCGLALDFENQARLNTERITNWCSLLMQEFD